MTQTLPDRLGLTDHEAYVALHFVAGFLATSNDPQVEDAFILGLRFVLDRQGWADDAFDEFVNGAGD
jgi:hypothetical protein